MLHVVLLLGYHLEHHGTKKKTIGIENEKLIEVTTVTFSDPPTFNSQYFQDKEDEKSITQKSGCLEIGDFHSDKAVVASENVLSSELKDPAKWPRITDKIRVILAELGPKQTKGLGLRYPEGPDGRKFSDSYYTRTMKNIFF